MEGDWMNQVINSSKRNKENIQIFKPKNQQTTYSLIGLLNMLKKEKENYKAYVHLSLQTNAFGC